MRRSLALIALAPFLHFACVDDPAAPAGGVDAGAPGLEAGADATTPPDASIDSPAPNPDAAPDTSTAAVTVNVLRAGAPLADVTIVFNDATGAVIDSGKTDALGRIVRVVPSGSSVTAVFGTSERSRLMTVLGVEPGDTLTAIDPTGNQVADPAAEVRLDSMPTPPPTGTTGYAMLIGGCGTGYASVPTSLYLYEDCFKDGKFPILLRAQDTSGELGYAFKKDNTINPDGGTTPVDVAGAWSDAGPLETIIVQNLADGGYYTAAYSEVVGGVVFLSNSGAGMQVDGGVPPTMFNTHPGYPDFVQHEVVVAAGNLDGGFTGYQAIASRAVQDGGPVVFDLATALPKISAAGYLDDAAAYARPTVQFTPEGSLAGADGAISRIAWDGYVDGGSTVYTGEWIVVAPPSATAIQAPALPAALADFAPRQGAYMRRPLVAFVDGTFIASYAELRATAAALPPARALVNDNGVGVVPPLPAAGVLRLTAITEQGD